MNDPMPGQTPPQAAQAPSLKWLFYILGGASLLVILAIIFAFLVVWVPIKGYVSDTPYEIEHFPISPAQTAQLKTTLAGFFKSDSLDTLLLSTSDINHLLSENRALANYGIQYRIELQDSLFNLRCVVSAQKIRNQMASIIKFVNINGYINAEMEGKIKLEGEKLLLIPIRSQMNGRPAPFTLLGKRSQIELVQFFSDPMLYLNTVRALKSIAIHHSELVIVKK